MIMSVTIPSRAVRSLDEYNLALREGTIIFAIGSHS